MRPLGLLLLWQLIYADWPVSIISDFEGIQLADTESQISLLDSAAGYNLTYSIAGSYTDADGYEIDAPQPLVVQRFVLQGQYPKQTQYTPSLMLESVLPKYESLRFSVSEEAIYIWDLNSFADNIIVSVSSYPLQADTVGVITLTNKDGSWEYMGVLMLTGGKVNLEVLNYVPFELKSIGLIQFESQWKSVAVAACSHFDSFSYDCIFAGTNSAGHIAIIAEGFDNSTQTLTPAYPLVFNTPELPIAIHIDDYQTVICFKSLGVYILSTGPLFENSKLEVEGRIYEPSVTYLACTIDSYTIFVSTSSKTLIYDYGFELQLVYEYPAYSDISAKVTESTGFSGSQYAAFAISSGEFQPSFRVIKVSSPSLIDQELCSFVPSCTIDSVVFTVFEANRASFVLFETNEYFIAYMLIEEPVAKFPLGYAYTFTGTLTVTSGSGSAQKNVLLQSLDPQQPALYTTRNTLPEDGFLAPARVARALNNQDTFAARVYIPLSNYFSGQNLQYNVTLLSNDSSVLMDTPQMISFGPDFVFNASNPNSIVTYVECDNLQLIAVENNNAIYFFNALNEAEKWMPLFQARLEDDGFSVTDMISIYCDHSNCDNKKDAAIASHCLLVIQKSQSLDLEEFNFQWLLYELNATNAQLQPSNLTFPNSQSHRALQQMQHMLWAFLPDRLKIVSFVKAANSKVAFATQPKIIQGRYYPVKFPLNYFVSQGFSSVVDDSCRLLTIAISAGQEPSITVIHDLNCVNPESLEILIWNYHYALFDPTLSEYLTVLHFDTNTQSYRFPLMIAGYNARALDFGSYLVVYEQTAGTNTLLFLDKFAASIRSLAATVDIGAATKFALVPIDEDLKQYLAVTYDGQKLTRILIGQRGAYWTPQSDLVPRSCTEHTIWTRLTFPFDKLENTLSHAAQIHINAISPFSGIHKERDVNITLVNTGSFIMDRLNHSSPLFSNNTIEIGPQGLELQVPTESFIGADVTYGLVVNGNLGTPLQPSMHCDSRTFFACVSAKYVVEKSIDPTHIEEGVAVNSAVFLKGAVYYLSDDRLIEEVAGRTTNEIQLGNSSMSNCETIIRVNGADDALVIYCTSYDSWTAYLVYLNVTSGESYYQAASWYYNVIVAGFDKETNSARVILLAGVVNVYDLINGEFTTSKVISEYSLGLPIFMPISAVSFDADHLLLLEEFSNTVFLLERQKDYSPVARLQPGSAVLYELALTPDRCLLAITQNTTVLRYSITSTGDTFQFSLERVISPVDTLLDLYPSLWLFDIFDSPLAQSADGTLIAFVSYEQNETIIRVINLTESDSSAIVATSPVLDNHLGKIDTAFISFMDLGDGECNLFVFLDYSYGEHQRVDFVHIYREVTVTFHPYTTVSPIDRLVSLQLLAFNAVSRVIGPAFLLNFTE